MQNKEEKENIYYIDSNGNVTFKAPDGEERVLTQEAINEMKRQAKERLDVSDAIAKARQMVADASTDVERRLAEKNLTEALRLRDEMIKEHTEKINAIEKPSTHTAEKLENGILSSVVALFEGYIKTRERIKLIVEKEKTAIIENFPEKAKEGEKEFTDYLDENGVQWEREASTKNLASEVGNQMFVLIGEKKDGGHDIITFPLDKLSEKLEDESLKKRIEECKKISAYQVEQADFIENQSVYAEEDKEKAMENLRTAVRIGEASEKKEDGKQEKISAEQILRDYNKSQTDHLMQFYEPKYHRVDPRTIDFTELGRMGVDLRQLNGAQCRSLLQGNLSELTDGYTKKDGERVKFKFKFRFGKNNRGKSIIVKHEALESAIIPDQILGTPLTPALKGQLDVHGMLDETLTVKVNGRTIEVMPYIDKETNQILLRNYSAISLPEEVGGQTLTAEQKEKLLLGGTVRMTELVDNAGQTYNGYAKINPLTGGVMTIKAADLQYEYQVAANNRGARTEDLKQDKDTFLKKGQTANDDEKPKKTKKEATEKKPEQRKGRSL